jgi:hypothetical protein
MIVVMIETEETEVAPRPEEVVAAVSGDVCCPSFPSLPAGRM